MLSAGLMLGLVQALECMRVVGRALRVWSVLVGWCSGMQLLSVGRWVRAVHTVVVQALQCAALLVLWALVARARWALSAFSLGAVHLLGATLVSALLASWAAVIRSKSTTPSPSSWCLPLRVSRWARLAIQGVVMGPWSMALVLCSAWAFLLSALSLSRVYP